MFKKFGDKIWAFDAEWVPDVKAGRLLYNIEKSVADKDVINQMFKEGGADEKNPNPYLKTAICRVVSISAFKREVKKDGSIVRELVSLPRLVDNQIEVATEAQIIKAFLKSVGESKPQIVGFNSGNADLKALIQRGVINGIQAKDFCKRPDKPWEGVDYFAKFGASDDHIDLFELFSSRPGPSLHEMCTLSGIPGKFSGSGTNVLDLWLNGSYQEIVAYNDYDAISTYLLFIRTAMFCGFLTNSEYQKEMEQTRAYLLDLIPQRLHLEKYVEYWGRCVENVGSERICTT